MVKKTRAANDASLFSPARPLKRPKPAENASQGSGTPKASTSRKSDSSKPTPTRSSTRKSRSAAKIAAMEDSSDDDSTPPPSIVSSSPMKKRIPEKRAPRNEKEVTEPDVIDLTVPPTFSPKSPRKRPKIDRRLPVDLNSFINLCSDEEMHPRPRKKRKVLPADEVILISSGDEAESIHRLGPPARVQVSKERYVAGHSAASAGPIAQDIPYEMETYHNPPDLSTLPPVSPLENDDSEPLIVDITETHNMTGIEDIPTPKLSRARLNALYQESLQNQPVKSSTSEEMCSTPFCNTPGPEPKPYIHKVVSKQAKRALLTTLIFARPMTSLGRMSRPRANVIPQCPNPVPLIEFSVEETPLRQCDTVPLDVQKVVLAPLKVSSPPSENTVHGAANPDRFLDAIPCEDIYASPLMDVDETEVEPGSSARVNDRSVSGDPGETPVTGLPSMEIVVREKETTEAHDPPTPCEGQADDHPPKVGFTEAELDINSGPVNVASLSKSLDTTTWEEICVSSTSPLMEVDETEVEPVFSTRLDDRSGATGEISVKGVLEIAVGENVTTKARDDMPTPQADDHPTEAGFTEAELGLDSIPVDVATLDKFVDKTTCDEIRVSASSLMEIDETEVEPNDRSGATGEISVKGVPSMETVVGENVTTKAHDDMPTPQADDHPPEAGFTEAELDLNSVPADVATLDKLVDKTTSEETHVSSASPLMEVDEESVFSARANDRSGATDETSVKGVPPMEAVMGENVTTKAHDTPTPQTDGGPPEAGFSEAELGLNSVPVDVLTLDKTTCEKTHATFASPLMGVDGSEVEPVFSAQVKATYDCSDAVPTSSTGESSTTDVPSMEIVRENKTHDTPTPDDHLPETSLTEAEPLQNSELPSGNGCVSISSGRDTPMHSCATSLDDVHHGRLAVQADALTHPTFRDTPSRDLSHKLESNTTDEPLGNTLPHETLPVPQTYINSSIFELEHSPNLTFQILFASNKILDDVSDLAISLPCYPERLHY